ncbi:hypothetical protein ACFYKT_18455 [Cytobacillus sp. FJAT-53684]|uniref:Acetylglutamate kinase n=1 Tax=Cytobacillus mangrovibacter TaxID=3299024 RepID=A0ABW6K2A4_9BACI
MGRYDHSPVKGNFVVHSRMHPHYPRVFPHTQQSNNFVSQAAVDLMRDNRSLWEEHVAWTRMTIISLIYKLPDINFVVARLLKNATDMGEMIRPLYGDAAAKKYSSLIQEHLLIAADLVKAAIAGNEQAAKMAEQKWYANADEISAFLNRVNPFLPEEEMRNMFYHHLDLTKQEALTMINKDFKKDIEIYDKIEKQAREMADTISDAMIKLYPNKFR